MSQQSNPIQQEQNISLEQEGDIFDDPAEDLRRKTQQLQEQQQILKQIIAQKQLSNNQLFSTLTYARNQLLQLTLSEYNQDVSAGVDLGVYLEILELKRQIQRQYKRIEQLKQQINKQGLTSNTNNQQVIQLKRKFMEFEHEIVMARKFTSTQHVRVLFECPSALKITYEEMRVDCEKKIRMKEALEAEKVKYEEKRKELNRQLQEKRNQYHELTRQLNKLVYLS